MKSKERAFTQKLRDKLQTQMVRLGLNGQRLAQRSRVSDSEISRILSGQSTPGLENAFRLARAVGVSLDYLADDALDTDPLQASDPLSNEDREVLELVKRIGARRAANLLDIIRVIGYETAMQRLVSARPVIEVDPEEARTVATQATNGVGASAVSVARPSSATA